MILTSPSPDTRAVSIPRGSYTTTLTLSGPDAGHLLLTVPALGWTVRDERVGSIAQANIVALAEDFPLIPTGGHN